MGLRLEDLGTSALSWRDLYVVLRQAPRTSAYARSSLGVDALWGLGEHLAASILDALNLANWQRGNQGAKSPSPRPKPTPRPGADSGDKKFGSGAIPIGEFNDWWESG